MSRPIAVASLLFLLSAIAGCAQPAGHTTLERVWRDTAYDGHLLRQVVVMAIDPDEDFRRSFEDRMARALEARGVAARPSYSLMPIGSVPDRGAVEAAVQNSSSDGLLVTQFEGTQEHTEYVPAHVEHRPSPAFGGAYRGWETVYQSGYTRAEKETRLTSSLYDATGRLVWTGTTRSLAEPSDRNLDNQVDRQVLAALESDHLIR